MPHNDLLPFARRNLPKNLGFRLRKQREKKRLSRSVLANTAGIGSRTLARIERGEQAPLWSTLKQICKALGIDPYSVAPRWSRDSEDLPESPEIVPGLGLRALRLQCGMTLVGLAGASGVSAATISRFERGLIASRLLASRADQSGIRFSHRDQLLENDRVALALKCQDSAALREACELAARGMSGEELVGA